MALETEDITINNNDGWTAIVLTGTVIHITEVRKNNMLFRFGIDSTSKGTELGVGEKISVDETIYAKPSSKLNTDVLITVARDS